MDANLNSDTSKSQKYRILAHLESGKSLTSLQALYLFDCARLASRINDLKNDGVQICKTSITLDNGKRITQYSIPKKTE